MSKAPILGVLVAVLGCEAGSNQTSSGAPEGVSAGAAAPVNVAEPDVSPAPSSHERWRKMMTKTPLPKHGCFHAEEPDGAWTEVPCVQGPSIPHAPVAGNGNDYVATVTG